MVAKYPARLPEKRADPVVYLAGGPGDIAPLDVNAYVAVRRERHQFRRECARTVGIGGSITVVDPHVAAIGPAQFLQSLLEGREASLFFGIVCDPAHEHADATHPVGLLRARRQRARCGAAKTDYKLPPSDYWHLPHPERGVTRAGMQESTPRRWGL